MIPREETGLLKIHMNHRETSKRIWNGILKMSDLHLSVGNQMSRTWTYAPSGEYPREQYHIIL